MHAARALYLSILSIRSELGHIERKCRLRYLQVRHRGTVDIAQYTIHVSYMYPIQVRYRI